MLPWVTGIQASPTTQHSAAPTSHGFFLPFLFLSGFLPLTTSLAPAPLTTLPLLAGCACGIQLPAGFPLLPSPAYTGGTLTPSGPRIPRKPCRKHLVFGPAHQTPLGVQEGSPKLSYDALCHSRGADRKKSSCKPEPPRLPKVELAFNSHHWKGSVMVFFWNSKQWIMVIYYLNMSDYLDKGVLVPYLNLKELY